MYLTRSEYDRDVNTFSRDGRLFQVEYAIEAIKLGSTAVGVRSSEGVVLAVEKRVTSPLMETASIEKILEVSRKGRCEFSLTRGEWQVDTHIGCAMSGLIADARTLVDHARVEAQNHRFTYDERITTESVTQAVSDLSLKFGEDSGGRRNKESLMSRPFGVALLLAGIDETGVHLFHTDPSGTFSEWSAKAIGGGEQGAQTMLQEQWSRGITLVEAETLALTTLKEIMEEKLSDTNVEIASVSYAPDGKTGVFHVYTKPELSAIVARLPAGQAQQAAAAVVVQ